MQGQKLRREIEKLFPALEAILPGDTLKDVATATPDNVYLFHFGLGTFVRNNLLNSGSRLYEMFLEEGTKDRDDMSAMILKLFCEYLSSE